MFPGTSGLFLKPDAPLPWKPPSVLFHHFHPAGKVWAHALPPPGRLGGTVLPPFLQPDFHVNLHVKLTPFAPMKPSLTSLHQEDLSPLKPHKTVVPLAHRFHTWTYFPFVLWIYIFWITY